MKKQTFFLLTVTVVILLTGCFSSWNGGDGTITISFGGSSGRSVEPTDPDFWEKVSHNIELSGSTTRTIPVPVGAKSFHAEVKPGLLHITVTAIFDDKPYAKGSESVVVYPGGNTPVAIEMEREPVTSVPVDVDIVITFDQIEHPDIKLNDVNIILSKNDSTTEITITLENEYLYKSINWHINGITGTGESFILDAANPVYNSIGKHELTLEVVVLKNDTDWPYTKIIEFEVID